MEKDVGFGNCPPLGWPMASDEAAAASLSYPLSDHLFATQLDAAFGLMGRFEAMGNMSNSFNYPPRLNLSVPGGAQQSFTEKPVKIPCFPAGASNYGGKFPLSETGRLHRAQPPDFGAAEISLLSRSTGAEEGELGCVRAESSASEHTINDGGARKRKSSFKMVQEREEANAKRNRGLDASSTGKEELKPKIEVGGDEPKMKKEDAAKTPSEAPKQDYIHVRARRGQATDAHSLAERVRREKISERMKFLQNLVPGCNKVTGKAVMLDEIINYVQSLQRQVEFLSMKLATVNPRLDVNLESLLQKDVHQPSSMFSQAVFQLETTTDPAFSFAHQPAHIAAPLQSIEGNCSTNPINLMISDGFAEAGAQVGAFWGDDLHRVVQMGSVQNQEGDSS